MAAQYHSHNTTEAAAGKKQSDDGFVAKLVTHIIKNIQVWFVL